MESVDTLVNIFRHLTFPEIYNLCQTSKQYQDLCQKDDLWQKYFQKGIRAAAESLIQHQQFEDAAILSRLSPTFKELFADKTFWQGIYSHLSVLISVGYSVSNLRWISQIFPYFNSPEYWIESVEYLYFVNEEMELNDTLALFLTQNPYYQTRVKIQQIVEQIPIFQQASQDPAFWESLITNQGETEMPEGIPDLSYYFFHDMYWRYDPISYNRQLYLDWLKEQIPKHKGPVEGYLIIDFHHWTALYATIIVGSSFYDFLYKLYPLYPSAWGDILDPFDIHDDFQISTDEASNYLRISSEFYRLLHYPLS